MKPRTGSQHQNHLNHLSFGEIEANETSVPQKKVTPGSVNFGFFFCVSHSCSQWKHKKRTKYRIPSHRIAKLEHREYVLVEYAESISTTVNGMWLIFDRHSDSVLSTVFTPLRWYPADVPLLRLQWYLAVPYMLLCHVGCCSIVSVAQIRIRNRCWTFLELPIRS